MALTTKSIHVLSNSARKQLVQQGKGNYQGRVSATISHAIAGMLVSPKDYFDSSSFNDSQSPEGH